MNSFNFTTDLSLDDYKRLCKLRTKASVIISALAGGAFIYITLMRFFQNSKLLHLLVGVLGCVIVGFGVNLYIMLRAKKIYNMSTVSEQLSISFSEKGILQKSQNGDTELEWDDVFKVVEDKKCYFVFLTRSKAFYFPKRNFNSPEHEKEFVEWIVEKVRPEKIKFKK